MTAELIQRINALAKKAKTEGLTAEEKEEQVSLRQQYLENFRNHFEQTLASVVVVDENGHRRSLSRDGKKA